MKIRLILFITFLSIIVFSCNNEQNYIIPIDFGKYEKEYVPGLTQEGSQAIQARQWGEISEKTIGKVLPEIIIVDKPSVEIELKNLIKEKTLLVLTGAHCGWGMEGLTNDLPNALEKLHNKNVEINVICLLIKADSDNEDLENFTRKYNELKSFYPNIYIIPEKESKRLNVFANPTRMIIEEDHSVTSIGLGVSTPERLYEELKKLLPTTAHTP